MLLLSNARIIIKALNEMFIISIKLLMLFTLSRSLHKKKLKESNRIFNHIFYIIDQCFLMSTERFSNKNNKTILFSEESNQNKRVCTCWMYSKLYQDPKRKLFLGRGT